MRNVELVNATTYEGSTEVTRPEAIATPQIDDGCVRVVRWDFAPGAETTRHVHQYDYVVVPLTSGTLTIEAPDGSVATADLAAGVSYNRSAGVEHNVVNDNVHEFAFVEIELLA